MRRYVLAAALAAVVVMPATASAAQKIRSCRPPSRATKREFGKLHVTGASCAVGYAVAMLAFLHRYAPTFRFRGETFVVHRMATGIREVDWVQYGTPAAILFRVQSSR